MAVAFDATTAPCAGTGTGIDTTGETLALPGDTQQVEVYLSAAGCYKRGAHDASLTWLPIPATSWTTIRELDGQGLALKASTGTVTAYVDAISPRGVRGGR